MAHGWLAAWGGDKVQVFSAGTRPGGVHPLSIRVMSETGVDISGHTSDHVEQYASMPFDAVITVCDAAAEACPVFPGAAKVIHHAFEDPDDKTGQLKESLLLERFRRVRDEIGEWTRRWLAEQGIEPATLSDR